MSTRLTLVVAFVVTQLVGGGMALPEEAASAPNSLVEFSCNVSLQEIQMPSGFDEDFCDTLMFRLADDIAIACRLAACENWIADGRAVKVDVRLLSAHGAQVTVDVGYIKEGVFAVETSVESSLSSYDGPLSPTSSRALVRGIGIQLGLVQ